MKNIHQYQSDTVSYIKEKIHTLNMTILLGITIVLFIAVKYAYQVLEYVPQSSVLALLAMLSVLTGIIYTLSKITTVRAINAIESYSGKLNTLLSTSRDVHRIDYSDVLLGRIIESAAGITNADGAVLMIADGKSVLIKITRGIADKNLEKLRFIKSEGIAERVIDNGETINISDADRTETTLSDMDLRIINGAKSLLCIPLISDGKRTGALGLIKKGKGLFNAEDEELLQYFVEQSSHAMTKNIFYEDLNNFEIQLTNILVEAIERLTSSKGHLRRTVKYALIIGQGTGMSENDLKILYRAALLHDIGFLKVNIDEILSVEQYNAHALLGFRILDQINFYRDISSPVLYHHEKFDGTGYPRGLSGETIPLISRIISIAEVFDVMMNRQAHKCKARNTGEAIPRYDLSFGEAISELRENAGTQFDPHLVDLFINNISEDDVEIDQTTSGSPDLENTLSGITSINDS